MQCSGRLRSKDMLLRRDPDLRNDQRRPKAFAVTARSVLPDDPDYQRLWQIVNKNNQNRYIEYQKRTSRPIPVVVLEPNSRPAGAP